MVLEEKKVKLIQAELPSTSIPTSDSPEYQAAYQQIKEQMIQHYKQGIPYTAKFPVVNHNGEVGQLVAQWDPTWEEKMSNCTAMLFSTGSHSAKMPPGTFYFQMDPSCYLPNTDPSRTFHKIHVPGLPSYLTLFMETKNGVPIHPIPPLEGFLEDETTSDPPTTVQCTKS